MRLPKVGIIYLTFATPEWRRDIDRCLASLERLDYPKERVELICVESRSSAGRVKEWFEQTWMPKSEKELPRMCYLFKDEQIGFAGNNNIGYEKAKELGCDYIYLLNEDTEVDQAFLRRAVERAEMDSQVAIVQSLILLGQDKNRINSLGNAYHYLGFGYSRGYLWTRDRVEPFFQEQRCFNPDLEIGYASGAGMLARVSALQRIGGLFDDRFFSYHEDTDASFAVRAQGGKVVIEPSSIIYHYYEEQKTQLKKNYWIERHRYVMLFSYYSWWTLLLILPMALLMEMGLILFSLRSGWWPEKWRVYKEVCSGLFWKWVQDRRQRIKRFRTVSDRTLLAYAVSSIQFQGETVKNPLLEYVGNPLMRIYWGVVKYFI